METLKHSEVTGAIIKAFYSVYNELGPGFLEKVYENALAIELRSLGFAVEQQKPITVLNFGKTPEFKRRIFDVRPVELFSHLVKPDI